MTQYRELSLESSFVRKLSFGLAKVATRPRDSFAWIMRGHLLRDPEIVRQTYWFTGSLPRVPLSDAMPGISEFDVTLPRAFDRKSGTSITVDEACHLAAITRWRRAVKVLEIGTYDGNSALVLAANVENGGSVVTIDLPEQFDATEQKSLTYAEGEFNLTSRADLGRQLRLHPFAERVRQVFGDSGSLDWKTLGGPFDLIFIDGSHAEEYVLSDSENALKVLAPGGILVWHDYGLLPAVSKVIDRLAVSKPQLKLFAVEGTRLVVGLTGTSR